MSTESDVESVLCAAREHEPWALRAIWDALAPKVAAYARRRGVQDPDDLTNEVFGTVFASLPSFVGDHAALRAFVFTVAHRRTVDDARRRYRRPPPGPYVQDGAGAGAGEQGSPSAEDEALERISTESTRRLLAVLAPDQRDVLVLRILGDLTVDQVAEVLGKSPGAVKALQRRGLETLRRSSPVRAIPLPRQPAITRSR